MEAALEGVFGTGKGREQMPERMLAAAARGHDVVEVVLKRRHLHIAQAHALPEPARTYRCDVLDCSLHNIFTSAAELRLPNLTTYIKGL